MRQGESRDLRVDSAPFIVLSPDFSQLEESEAKCAEAQRTQQAAAQQLESLHMELETLSRSKALVCAWRCKFIKSPGRVLG